MQLLYGCFMCRFFAPSGTFWQDIEAQVLESLRQAKRAPRITDLVCSTEEAIFLHSKQLHYAQLASALFGKQVRWPWIALSPCILCTARADAQAKTQ
jgi:hypothetical protein